MPFLIQCTPAENGNGLVPPLHQSREDVNTLVEKFRNDPILSEQHWKYFIVEVEVLNVEEI